SGLESVQSTAEGQFPPIGPRFTSPEAVGKQKLLVREHSQAAEIALCYPDPRRPALTNLQSGRNRGAYAGILFGPGRPGNDRLFGWVQFVGQRFLRDSHCRLLGRFLEFLVRLGPCLLVRSGSRHATCVVARPEPVQNAAEGQFPPIGPRFTSPEAVGKQELLTSG